MTKISSGKRRYIDNLENGLLIAYKKEDRVQSGKIVGIDTDHVVVEDFDGYIYPVLKSDIIWVKTGQRWPKEIFRALQVGGKIED